MSNKAPYCKDAYIGAPVRAHVHACEYCNGKGCDHCNGGKGCGCKNGGSICSVVVDDANNRIYLYGDNIVHENYHMPGGNCLAYVAVADAGFEAPNRLDKDEFFEGQQDNNEITLTETPLIDNTLLVFLNGVKQREGEENDYVINGKTLHFNFYELLETDTVEVMYTYGGRY